MSDISGTTPTPAESPTALPTDLPADATPAQPSEPSPISDAALPALVEQLRPIFAEVVNAAVNEAIAAVPTPTLRPGTVTTVNMTTKEATVTLDEGGAAEPGTAVAQIICELPVVNDRVMVLFVPPNAAFIIGIVGGSGVPAGVVYAYTGPITSDAGGSADTAPPRGHLWAYGQDYDGGRYPALWAAIGTSYGTGATTGSGKLPDMRGRMPIGLDNMGGSDAGRTSIANVIGTTGGAESHTLATANLPSHDHSLNSHTHSLSGATVTGSLSGTTGNQSNLHSHNSPNGSNFVTSAGINTNLAAGGGFTLNTSSGASTTTENANHTHSFSGSISGGSVSGTSGAAAGNTGTAGSGTAVTHLPPYLVVHWIIKA